MRDEDVLRTLNKYGINSFRELEVAIKKQERLKIGVFADPARGENEKGYRNTGVRGYSGNAIALIR